MTLPTALLAFRPLCDEPDCHRLMMEGSDYCGLHSGCSYVEGPPGFHSDCGNEIYEVLSEDEGRCYAHRTDSCTYCEYDATDPGTSDPLGHLCRVCRDEALYEYAVENYGYRGAGPGRYY